ncbi:basic proline-rich protein-like [Balaenoptera musculus]|uniref:Basic proline-rich protein-like n=1 Tax=Balaenoptera musculus TaxID=9771 RepID=A0A8B8V4Y2_BALMU|nr:basic proline-rich protein-like [Balaenoptera musculus]
MRKRSSGPPAPAAPRPRPRPRAAAALPCVPPAAPSRSAPASDLPSRRLPACAPFPGEPPASCPAAQGRRGYWEFGARPDEGAGWSAAEAGGASALVFMKKCLQKCFALPS